MQIGLTFLENKILSRTKKMFIPQLESSFIGKTHKKHII